NHARTPRATQGQRILSAAGDRRDDGDRLTVGHRRLESLEEPDVLVVEENVDEPPELSGVVEQALGEARVGGVEGLQGLADGGPVDRHLPGASGEVAQLGRDSDGHAHRAASLVGRRTPGWSAASWSTAASKAARVGSM